VVRLREAARDREPQAGAAAIEAAALERLEDPFALGGGHARAVIDDADERAGRRLDDLDADGLAVRRVLGRVLEQVPEPALDLLRVHAHGRRLLGQLDLDTTAGVP